MLCYACSDENGNSETEIYINKLVVSFYGTLVQGPIYLSWDFVEPEGLNKMCVYKSFTHFYDRSIRVRNQTVLNKKCLMDSSRIVNDSASIRHTKRFNSIYQNILNLR